MSSEYTLTFADIVLVTGDVVRLPMVPPRLASSTAEVMKQHTAHLKPTASGARRALRELKTQHDLEAQFAKKREAALARQREHDAAMAKKRGAALARQREHDAAMAKKREAALARQREHDAAVDEGFTGVEQKREVMELTAQLRRLHERGAAESVTLEVAHARVTVPRDAKMVEVLACVGVELGVAPSQELS